MSIDVLGSPYEVREIQLPDDEEGKVIATLVKRPSNKQSQKAVLYVHGYCDYFFQKEMAEKYTDQGFHFYALDLRKYGRSLLPHQTPNFCKNIEEYYPEMDRSLDVILNEDGNKQVLLNGHSTGGLLASLYAHDTRDQNRISALFLNSPFFEFNENLLARKVLLELVSAIGTKKPYRKIPGGLSELYGQSVHKDFKGEWSFNTDWKPIQGFQLRAGWLKAILDAHKRLHAGLQIPCPILVMFSNQSSWVNEWDDNLLCSDTILNVEHISKYADVLGNHITKVRIENGMHDLILSAPNVRRVVYEELFTWLRAYVP
ncbi:MAG: alpha/beta hydrolase [Leptospiraceae bacterium]|nr:alpha/beta hydrolase [Leptospiraceae bacterium]MCP5493613.1 alpha/beta hydrolase [Leptospiraceae bacterium]